jgi:hypothetical protein
MKKALLIFFICGFSVLSCDTENNISSPFENRFVKFYGGEGDQEGVDFLPLSDGTIILLGNSNVAGASLGQQIYLAKINSVGEILWELTFGSSGDDVAKEIALTSDNRLVIAGETVRSETNRDVYIKLVTTEGNPLDSVRVGFQTRENTDSDEEVNSVSILQDGFIVCGRTSAVKTLKTDNPNDLYDALHIKFSNSLVMADLATGEWSNTSGFSDSDDALVKLFQVSPTTYYGFGYTNAVRNNSTDYKYWAFSLGAKGIAINNGTALLDRLGSVNRNEFLSDVIESPLSSGGGYVLSGVSESATTQSYVVKLTSELFKPLAPPAAGFEDNVLADQILDDLGEEVNSVTRLTNSISGGYFLLNNSKQITNQGSNISLSKLSNSCIKQWQIFFGGVGDDYTGSVHELPDGRILVFGTMTIGGAVGQKKIALIKVNQDGRLID